MRIATVTDLSLFETTKGERYAFAESVVNNAKEGLINPLKLHLQVKCLEDLIKQKISKVEANVNVNDNVNDLSNDKKSFDVFWNIYDKRFNDFLSKFF